MTWFRSSWIYYTVWILINCWIFWNTYKLYKGQPQYYYLRQMLGSGLCISRGSGAVLNLSCSLVLLPACKRVVSLVRRWMMSSRASPSTNRYRILRTLIFNQAERIHVTCAMTIILASVIHTGAHIVNAINFSRHYNPVWTEVNLAAYPNQDPFLLIVTTIPGLTGLLMILILLVILITSSRWFRSRHFNAFYYTHNFLFGPFFLLLITHPISGCLKEQINWQDHQPELELENEVPVVTKPIFISMPNHTWLWASIPLVIYLIDWVSRIVVRRRPALISRAVDHEDSQVLELFLDRCWIRKAQPGQYVLLQCPAISGFEWHPFSLSSCSDVTHASWTVHLKTEGDWCNQLKEMVTTPTNQIICKDRNQQVELYLDGPFSSPLEDVLRSRTAICIAGGIGLTPFLSIFHHLIRNGWPSRPDRLHILWCVPEVQSLSWASTIIDQLIEDAWASPRPDKLEIRLHITQQTESSSIILDSQSNTKDLQYPPPNLIRRIEYGRPNWVQLFSRWKEVYPRQRVDVFSCGPGSLNRQIERVCRPLGNFALFLEQFS